MFVLVDHPHVGRATLTLACLDGTPDELLDPRGPKRLPAHTVEGCRFSRRELEQDVEAELVHGGNPRRVTGGTVTVSKGNPVTLGSALEHVLRAYVGGVEDLGSPESHRRGGRGSR